MFCGRRPCRDCMPCSPSRAIALWWPLTVNTDKCVQKDSRIVNLWAWFRDSKENSLHKKRTFWCWKYNLRPANPKDIFLVSFSIKILKTTGVTVVMLPNVNTPGNSLRSTCPLLYKSKSCSATRCEKCLHTARHASDNFVRSAGHGHILGFAELPVSVQTQPRTCQKDVVYKSNLSRLGVKIY